MKKNVAALCFAIAMAQVSIPASAPDMRAAAAGLSQQEMRELTVFLAKPDLRRPREG